MSGAVDLPLCSTCGSPYAHLSMTVCSNSFHCCRLCVWEFGRVILPCRDHGPVNTEQRK